jgi:hypothetical protein
LKDSNKNYDFLKFYGIANNNVLTLGLGLKGGNIVKTVDLYCKGHKPEKSSYIDRNDIRRLRRVS